MTWLWGNCTPDEQDELKRQQDEACNRTKGLGMCDHNEIEYGRAEIFDVCAQARINIVGRYFAKGDAGHKNQINQNFRNAVSCARDSEVKSDNLMFKYIDVF
ncbi:hypothetical protein [Vreelandella sp. EE27]